MISLVVFVVASVAGDLIVQFERRATLASLHAVLRRHGFTPVMRSNVAVRRFSTDFALVLEEADARRVRAIAGVKRVWLNRRISVSPLNAEHDDADEPAQQQQLVDLIGARSLWQTGVRGGGVRVAVFDTGLRSDHPHFKSVREVTNWTDERTLDDALGHGTFVAGVIAGGEPACLGVAPDADLHVFRVFTSARVSYTAWFLDAMNYAIHSEVDVLNLSIGGPDFLDRPFVEKVWELSANNIVVVSAIGNDGPLYGTLNNPADQMDVIGVGGVDFAGRVAKFSSRGMTAWELPRGYGRAKPDVVAFGKSVRGSKVYGGCRSLSGTSVASPVVAGSVALLIGAVPRRVVNPASVKQALLETAARVGGGSNLFEQGAGQMRLGAAVAALRGGVPRASFFPAAYDLTDCPYMWPYCAQPLYVGAVPLTLNATLLNGLGVTGEFVGPIRWLPGVNGEHVQVAFERPAVLWPWSGWLAIRVAATTQPPAPSGEWLVEGVVEARVRSPPARGEREFREQSVRLPVRLRVVRTPPRSRRLLWDQFHQLRYPAGYVPRDVLAQKHDTFDWNGDHPHTNFRRLFEHVRRAGFYVEVLGEHYGCVDLAQYGALLVVDTEDEFAPAERDAVRRAVARGLGLIVAADWYNVDVMRSIRFFDENTRQWWTPATGGANVPALNELLADYGIALSDAVVRGELRASDGRVAAYASGSTLLRFPAGGAVLRQTMVNETAELLTDDDASAATLKPAVLGVARHGAGVVAVLGDSACLDDAHAARSSRAAAPCFWLLDALLALATQNAPLSAALPDAEVLAEPLLGAGAAPHRLANSTLPRISNVVAGGNALHCEAITWHRVDLALRLAAPIEWATEAVSNSSGASSSRSPRMSSRVGAGAGTSQLPFWALYAPYLTAFVAALFVVATTTVTTTQGKKD
jgi:membrane-bound transcription factor site-1 protease